MKMERKLGGLKDSGDTAPPSQPLLLPPRRPCDLSRGAGGVERLGKGFEVLWRWGKNGRCRKSLSLWLQLRIIWKMWGGG